MAVYTTVDDAGSFYNPVLYTGTGSSNAITGVGFQPDFVWIKDRDATENHALMDAVRGVQKTLRSDTTGAETTDSDGLTAFGADGFTVISNGKVNTNTDDYVSWNWKAGTTTGIAGSPSITPSSYSFNATSGFSVIAYTGNGTSGATLPHGLGVAPKMIIVKELVAVDSWLIYNSILGATKYIQLQGTDAAATSTAMWNDTAPTTTLFYLGNSGGVNTNTNTYIAYCFAEIPGYSKMGGYTGNGSTDGTFVSTGFRPAAVLTKSQVVSDWRWYDNRRLGYNPAKFLVPNTTGVEGTGDIDLLSNGFKCRIATDPNNAQAMIYMAFAEAPLVNSSGVPVNAG